MWRFVIFVCLVSYAGGQSRGTRQHHGPGWDIRLAVPGDPGNDYPTLGNIPRTSFSCSGKTPGYYADLETNCQAFRVCTSGSTYGFQSFLCPNGTLFNQAVFVCDWWMNVNCQKSQDFINNNDKFGNLKLGPQLMKDIKKMITHPMRNPYDKSVMKSNLIVMQDYKPPIGQMFGALLSGPNPNSIYIPAKQVQAYNHNTYANGNVFAASTPSPTYVPPPASFNSLTPPRDAEVFQQQRQRQNGQYQQSGRLQSTQPAQILNGHAQQFTQNQNSFSFNNNGNTASRPTQIYNSPAQYRQQHFGNTQTFNQGGQLRQSGQYTDSRNQAQLNEKQSGFGISFSKQQYTNNAQLPLSNENTGQINNEAKQNLALVFNFLADSLNAAKEYSNIAKQNIVSPTPAQFQSVNSQELSRITNQISQLTASQYSNNQQNNNYNHAEIVPSVQTSTNGANQYQAAKYTSGFTQNQQQINSLPSRLTNQGYNYQNTNNRLTGNFQSNQKQIYSGQLYNLPVPDVTSQIYNAGSANLIQNSQQHLGTSQIVNQNGNVGNNLSKHSSTEVEIVQSQTLPLPAAKLQQFTPSNEVESFNSQEHSAQALLGNFLNNGNGISAQLQDKIVGTIPHPLEDNKLVTYKKDQSYYVYTKLNNNGNGQQNNVQSGQSAKLIQNGSPNVVFQFVPSVSYQLDDEREQQKILNAFQIDEYGSPKNTNQIQDTRRQDLISEVDYSVEHPQSGKQVDGQFNDLNTLYAGPSSYSAPQASVGSLEATERDQNLNTRLEQLEESNNGYRKEVPARQFSF
ncbi:putative uncharacterized protein DDB_G0289263 [Pectinophora gossypiella]|uniref:putative uncharacterized protein DDB_G0289263 n=1 Tax=Pectinophora gossypiella TaxID=13191 RepID=UPI00214E1A41|nr:putative uncharacterized protein DDB_G0289263 [Pectinophora gossypiella]